MNNLPLMYLGIALLLCALTIAGLGALLPWLKREKQGYPGEDAIEQALIPVASQAVMAAFKVSEAAVDQMKHRMDGVDKKKVADLTYDLLPPEVAGIPIGVIKLVITREKWQEMVQSAYDEFSAFYTTHEAEYNQALENWKSSLEAPLPTS